MFGLVVLLISALTQARSYVIPIAPSFLPKGFSAEDAEDKVHWSVTVGNEDELEDRKINWGNKARDFKFYMPKTVVFDVEDLDDKKIRFNPREITKIAGQVSQIGHILGYDAEDLDDVAFATVCAVIGAACAVAGTGCNIYSHVKGEDETEALEFDAEDLDDKKINLDEIEKIARQTEQIIQILKSDDADFENGFGKKLRKLGRRISRNIRRELPKITNIAGKVAQVGGALGFDEDDLDDYKDPLPGMTVHPHFPKPHGPILYW